MPKGKGLYTRKGAGGRTMYFRNGKMISQKSYRASRSRTSAPRKRSNPRRSTTRRKTTMARRRTYSRRKPAMPHPSITGMAAGLSVAQYLNTGSSVGITGISARTSGVIKDVADGKLNNAFTTLSKNAVGLATSEAGKKVLSTSIVLATAGGLARKWFPSVKLGGSKLYFKI